MRVVSDILTSTSQAVTYSIVHAASGESYQCSPYAPSKEQGWCWSYCTCHVTGLLHAKAVPTGARGGWRIQGWGPRSSWRRSAEHENALNCRCGMERVFELVEDLNFDVLGSLGSINISFCGWLMMACQRYMISYHRYHIPGMPSLFENKSMGSRWKLQAFRPDQFIS